MASLSTCHLGLWLGWQILLNLVKDGKTVLSWELCSIRRDLLEILRSHEALKVTVGNGKAKVICILVEGHDLLLWIRIESTKQRSLHHSCLILSSCRVQLLAFKLNLQERKCL